MSLLSKPVTDDAYDKEYGPAILDGVPLRTSVSALQTLDPQTYGGCHRKWWLDKIGGKREPETAAHTIGKRELHEPIERYYETGIEQWSPLILPGKHLIYPYGSKLLVEREIAKPLDSDLSMPVDLSKAPLRVDGIPLVGRIDLTHALGWYLNTAGERVQDPPNTFEVNDWKSTGKRQYAKLGSQLMTDTIQMPGYAQWFFLQAPSMEHARVSHSYFCKDPKDRSAWKATALVTREQVARRWEYVDGLGRVMRDVAAERTIDHVEGNRRSCDSYGRKGCPHKPSNGGSCTFGEFNSLSKIFGDQGARRLLSDDSADDNQPSEQELLPVMGLLKNATPRTSGITLPPNVTPANTPEHVGVNVALATDDAVDMIAALAAESAPSTNALPAITPELVAAFDLIESSGLGMPKLHGQAGDSRAAYLASKGKLEAAYTGAEWPGAGRLLGLATHTTNAEILALAANVQKVIDKQKAAAAANAAPVASPVSPETPKSDPAKAAVVEEPPKVEPKPAPVAKPEPKPAPVVTNSAPVVVNTTTTPTSDAPKADEQKPEAPKGNKRKAPRPKSEDEPFELYIDCVPSYPFTLADEYVSLMNVKLVEIAKLDAEGMIPDIRAAPKADDRFAFGAWVGTYEALVREAVADGLIPRGRYVVFTSGGAGDLGRAFANGMIAARAKTPSGYDGPLMLDGYTRGTR